MQSHYFDIKAIPQAEMIQSAVVAHIIQVLHKYLPQYNNISEQNSVENAISLSFPAYGQGSTVGGIVRVFASKKSLTAFHESIQVLSDYALITAVSAVPEQVASYAVFSRIHLKGKSHIKHLKQRAEKRGEPWTAEHEMAVTKKYQAQKHVPYLIVKSHSTNQKTVWLHIGKETRKKPSQGNVSGYGLNSKSQTEKMTVPVF